MRAFLAIIIWVLTILLLGGCWTPLNAVEQPKKLQVILIDWVYWKDPGKIPKSRKIDNEDWKFLKYNLQKYAKEEWVLRPYLDKDKKEILEIPKECSENEMNGKRKPDTGKKLEEVIEECEKEVRKSLSPRNEDIVILMLLVTPNEQTKTSWNIIVRLLDLRGSSTLKQQQEFEELDTEEPLVMDLESTDNGKKLYNSIRRRLAEGPWTIIDTTNNPYTYLFRAKLPGQQVRRDEIYSIESQRKEGTANIVIFGERFNMRNVGGEFLGHYYNLNNVEKNLKPQHLDPPTELKYRHKLDWYKNQMQYFGVYFDLDTNELQMDQETATNLTKNLKEYFTTKKLPYKFSYIEQEKAGERQRENWYHAKFRFDDYDPEEHQIDVYLYEMYTNSQESKPRKPFFIRKGKGEKMATEVVKEYLEYLSTPPKK